MTTKEPGMNGAFNSTFLNMNLRFLIINVQRKEKPKTLAD
jgi:hypothetical protein